LGCEEKPGEKRVRTGRKVPSGFPRCQRERRSATSGWPRFAPLFTDGGNGSGELRRTQPVGIQNSDHELGFEVFGIWSFPPKAGAENPGASNQIRSDPMEWMNHALRFFIMFFRFRNILVSPQNSSNRSKDLLFGINQYDLPHPSPEGKMRFSLETSNFHE
jgi:hypothetical protein